MKKLKTGAVPDFSRKKPVAGGKPVASGEQAYVPYPRQKQAAPTKSKNGGRRGT